MIRRITKRIMSKAKQWTPPHTPSPDDRPGVGLDIDYNSDEEVSNLYRKLSGLERYRCVNLQSSHTIEFRIFASTLIWKEFSVPHNWFIQWRNYPERTHLSSHLTMLLRVRKDECTNLIESIEERPPKTAASIVNPCKSTSFIEMRNLNTETFIFLKPTVKCQLPL